MCRIILKQRMHSKEVIYPEANTIRINDGNLVIAYLENGDQKTIVWHWDDILWYRVEPVKEEVIKLDECSDHNDGE